MNRDLNRDTIRKVLREWSPAPLPPRFQEDVWRRIERSEAAPREAVPGWALVIHWINNMLPKPALAISYVMLLLVVGLTAGWTQARQQNAQAKEEMSQRYVQLLDPNHAHGR
jgi:hypothetical protein